MKPPEPRPLPGHEPDRQPPAPPQPRPVAGEEPPKAAQPLPPKVPATALTALLICFLLSAFCFSAKAVNTQCIITNDTGSPLTFAFYTNNPGGTFYLASVTTVASGNSNAFSASGIWAGLVEINPNNNLAVIMPAGVAMDFTNGWASCLLSNGTAAYVLQQTGSAPATGQTFTWTNYGYNLTLPLPGYTQTVASTNGTAFFLDDTNVYTGWFTNAPSGMTYNTCHVTWTNQVTGDVFTNGTVSTNLAVSPFLQMGASPWVNNTWSNAPSAGPPLPWASYTINRY